MTATTISATTPLKQSASPTGSAATTNLGSTLATCKSRLGVDSPVGAELELELAEFETRCRRQTLDLIQPTIRRATVLETNFKDLRADVDKNQELLTELSRTATHVQDQMHTVDGFRDDMVRWDEERRLAQMETQDAVSSTRQEISTFRYKIEQQEAAVQSLQRTMDRVVGQVSEVQETCNKLRENVEIRLSRQGKLINGTKTDLESKFVALETKHNKMSDELWSEETGLMKAVTELKRTIVNVTNMETAMRLLQREKVSLDQLRCVQDEMTGLLQAADGNTKALKQMVDSTTEAVKEEFQIVSDTVASHTATMISEARTSYQVEISEWAKLRHEIGKFMQETDENICRLQGDLGQSQTETKQMMQTVQQEMDEAAQTRRRERSGAELQAMTLKEHLSSISTNSETMSRCIDHMSSIISTILQSERVTSALEMQDNTDRNQVALMGFQEGKGGRNNNATQVRSSVQAQLRSRSKGSRSTNLENLSASAEDSCQAVITVDSRCLSCSGQGQTVLSGFKMACLQYHPGPVTYAKRVWARSDLLELRDKLLQQVHEGLQNGPPSWHPKDMLAQKDNPLSKRPSISENSWALSNVPEFRQKVLDSVPATAKEDRPSSSSEGSGSLLKMPPLHVRQGMPVNPVSAR